MQGGTKLITVHDHDLCIFERSRPGRVVRRTARRDDTAEQSARQRHLQQAEADFRPLPFDAAAARAFGQVAADLRRADRKPAARAYDALIAAIAIAEDLPLYTPNIRDFDGITGLDVIPVPLQTSDP